MEGNKLKRRKQHIPEDLILRILTRLPVKSLARFKCVSKTWHSLVSRLKFNNKVIVSTQKSIQLVDLEASVIKAEQLDLPLTNPDDFRVIGSCNGFLCIAILTYDFVSGFVIWNPLTGKHNEVPLSSSLSSWNFENQQIGFGYDPYTDDYKIVRIRYNKALYVLREIKFEIYSQKSKSWKEGNLPWKIVLIPEQKSGTVVNGSALCWRIKYFKKFEPREKGFVFNSDTDKHIDAILHYDFKYNNFRMIHVEEIKGEAVSGKYFEFEFDLGAFDGRLSVVHDNYESEGCIDLWTLSGGGEERWIKMMSIPLPFHKRGSKPVCFMKCDEILMMIKRGRYLGRRFCIYFPGSMTFRELEVKGLEAFCQFGDDIYAESLISCISLSSSHRNRFA